MLSVRVPVKVPVRFPSGSRQVPVRVCVRKIPSPLHKPSDSSLECLAGRKAIRENRHATPLDRMDSPRSRCLCFERGGVHRCSLVVLRWELVLLILQAGRQASHEY